MQARNHAPGRLKDPQPTPRPPPWFDRTSYDYLVELDLAGWLWEFARRRWWDKAEQHWVTGGVPTSFPVSEGDRLLKWHVARYWRRRFCNLPDDVQRKVVSCLDTGRPVSSFTPAMLLSAAKVLAEPESAWFFESVRWGRLQLAVVDFARSDKELTEWFSRWVAHHRQEMAESPPALGNAEGRPLDGLIAGSGKKRRGRVLGTDDLTKWRKSYLLHTYDLCRGIRWDGEQRLEQTKRPDRALTQRDAIEILEGRDASDRWASERLASAKALIEGDAFHALEQQIALDRLRSVSQKLGEAELGTA